MNNNYWKNYYQRGNRYLREHKEFLNLNKTRTHCDFIVKALDLKKTDKILDLACGEGRITVELARRGFNVEGLDYSENLLKIAKESAKKENLSINFHCQDLHDLNLKDKYDKAFIFFSHLGILKPGRVFKQVSRILKLDGKFLLDCDNLFRLIGFLLQDKSGRFSFDPVQFELFEGGKEESRERYYTCPETVDLLLKNKIRPTKIYGDYQRGQYQISSPRMIIIGEKK